MVEPNTSVCGSGSYWGGKPWMDGSHSGDGGAAALILLPFVVILGVASVACAVENNVTAERWKRAHELDVEISELDRLRSEPR